MLKNHTLMAICTNCQGNGVIQVGICRVEQCRDCFGTGGEETELLEFDALPHVRRVHLAIASEEKLLPAECFVG